MATPTRYIWDKNDTNTAPLPVSLTDDGYPVGAIPGSAEFNELWRNMSLLSSDGHATGDLRKTMNPSPVWAVDGWILLHDGSIGSAASGATLRANADTEDLYTMFWDNYSDALAPVAGGRGADAATDFSANKALTLPSTSGRTDVNTGNGTYEPGSVFGSATHTLTKEETPPHKHKYLTAGTYLGTSPGGAFSDFWALSTINVDSGDGTDDGLSGNPHNIMQPSVSVYYFIKL